MAFVSPRGLFTQKKQTRHSTHIFQAISYSTYARTQNFSLFISLKTTLFCYNKHLYLKTTLNFSNKTEEQAPNFDYKQDNFKKINKRKPDIRKRVLLVDEDEHNIDNKLKPNHYNYNNNYNDHHRKILKPEINLSDNNDVRDGVSDTQQQQQQQQNMNIIANHFRKSKCAKLHRKRLVNYNKEKNKENNHNNREKIDGENENNDDDDDDTDEFSDDRKNQFKDLALSSEYHDLIYYHINRHQIDIAEEVFKNMKLLNIRPQYHTYSCIMDEILHLGNHEKMDHYFQCYLDDGYHPSSTILTLLISTCKHSPSAQHLTKYLRYFDEFQVTKTTTNYNDIIDASLRSIHNFDYLKVINEMEEKGSTPNCWTFCFIIHFFLLKSNYAKVKEALHLLHTKFKYIKPNTTYFELLIQFYHRTNNPNQVIGTYNDFLKMPDISDLDRISYTIIMKSYAQLGLSEDVEKIYHHLRKESKLDQVSILTLITCQEDCSRIDEFYEQIINLGVKLNAAVYNAIINLFAKKFDFVGAKKYVKKMVAQNIRPDNITISNLMKISSKLGYISESEELMEMAISLNLKIDAILLNTVILSCRKAGNIEKAVELFHLFKEHNISPDVVTLNILIQTCQKDGNFQQALEFFDYFRIYNLEPTLVTYRNLSSVAKTAGNMQAFDNYQQHIIREEKLLNKKE